MARIAWAVCLVLFLMTLYLYFVWIMAWIQIGHQPRYPHDDPKDISHLLSNLTSPLIFFLLFWHLPFGVGMGVAGADFLQRLESKPRTLTLMLGSPLMVWLVSALGFLLSILAGIPEWIID
jgi:hypothetical protein